MSGYVAPALEQLRREVNTKWPNRDKTSDGGVGDTSHAARKSDHNPDWANGGVVRARDFDKDGIDVDRLLLSLIGSPRIAYVIWNRRIWQNPAVYKNGGWQPYTGSNPHDKHIHVSIRRGYENGTQPWGLLDPVPGTTPTPTTEPEVPDVDANQAAQLKKAADESYTARRNAQQGLFEQRRQDYYDAYIREYGRPASPAEVNHWWTKVNTAKVGTGHDVHLQNLAAIYNSNEAVAYRAKKKAEQFEELKRAVREVLAEQPKVE